jgi:hypothetical protein
MMTNVIRDQNQIRGLGLREIAYAPGIDVNDLAGVFELHMRMRESGDRNVAVRINRRQPSGDRQATGARQPEGCLYKSEENDSGEQLHGSL